MPRRDGRKKSLTRSRKQRKRIGNERESRHAKNTPTSKG